MGAHCFRYFAAVGVFEPYLTPFWRQIGIPSAQISLLYEPLGMAWLYAAAAAVSAAGALLYRAGTRPDVAGAPMAPLRARGGSG